MAISRSILSSALLAFFAVLLCVSCSKVLKPYPSSSSAGLLAEADKALRRGDHDKALELSTKALEECKETKDCGAAQVALARAWLAKGDDDQAFTHSLTAVQSFREVLDPGEPLLILYRVHARRGNYESAAAALVDCINSSDDSIAKSEAADKLMLLGRRNLTEEKLMGLLRLARGTPAEGHLALVLARRYESSGRVTEAIRIVQRFLDENPSGGPGRELTALLDSLTGGPTPTGPVSGVFGEVRIGVLCPLSGKFSTFGQSLLRGIQLAAEEAGDVGFSIELIVEDSGSDPIAAARAAAKLCEEEGVLAVLGAVSSSATVSAAAVTNSHQVPLVSPVATDERISSLGPYVFQILLTPEEEIVPLVEFATEEMGFIGFAILHPDNDRGRALSSIFEREVEMQGGVLLASLPYPSGGTDFRELLAQVNECWPEVLFIPGRPEDVVLIASQTRFVGLEAQILGNSGWDSERVIELGGSAVENAVYAVDAAASGGGPAMESLRRVFGERFSEEPDRFAIRGAEAMRIVVDAMMDVPAGSVDREILREALAGYSGPGVLGGERVLAGQVKASLRAIHNGKPVAIGTFQGLPAIEELVIDELTLE